MVNYKVQPFLFEEGLKAFNGRQDKETLLNMYKDIPSGSCDSCGACCYDNVPLSASEFLSLVNELNQNNTLESTIEKVATWYVNQFETVQPCVFLGEDNRCGVYQVRPLVCRLFGHQTEVEQKRRVQIVLKQNQDLAVAVKEAYGITIKPKVVAHAIEQCGFIPETTFDQQAQDRLFDAVQQVDIPYYQEGYFELDYINLSLIEWFVLAYLDEDELLDQTIALNTGK